MTEQLPIPLSRADCYLATAAGMTGVILPANGPQSREEQYLARMAGDTEQEIPAPLPLKEQWLAIICGDTSVITPEIKGAFLIGQQMVRVEFLAKAAGIEGIVLPTNPNRTEQYFANIGGIVPDPGVLTQARGTYIVLNNVLRGIDSLDYIYGDTYQQTYSGKNLLPILNGTVTYYGLTITMDEGILTINGTMNTNQAANFKLTNGIVSNTGATIPTSWLSESVTNWNGKTLSIKLLSGTAPSASSAFRFYTNTTSHIWQSYPDITRTKTFDTNEDISCFVLFVNPNVTYDNAKYEIQLEEGSTATTYEPYVGGIASPNPDYPQDIQVVTGEQTVNVHGKNLWNSTFEAGGIGSEGSLLDRNDRFRASEYVAVQPNTTYTFSAVSSASDKVPQIYMLAYDSSKTYLRQLPANAWYNLPLTFTTTQDTYFVRLSGHYTDDSVIGTVGSTVEPIKNVQLEQGSATTYEPYQSQSYTISLGNMFDSTTVEAGDIRNNNQSIRLCSRQSLWLDAGTYTFSTNLTSPYYYGLTVNSVGAPPLSSYPTYIYDSGWKQASTTTFTLSQGGWFVVGYKKGDNENLTPADVLQFNYQLNRGTSVITPIELCKIGDYQDYIYKSGDDWYVHKACGKTDMSAISQGWANRNVDGDIYNTWFLGSFGAVIAPVLSNIFTYSSTVWGGIGKFGISDSGNLWLQTGDSTVNSSTITTWFTNKSAVIYYVLATPTDTKITDSTLIGQLEALNSAILPSPDAFIQVSGNLAGEIEISYYAKSE